MSELTRQQVDAALTMLSDCRFSEPYRRSRYLEVMAHDAALRQRVQELEKALMAEDFPLKHLIETRRCYHERNRIIRQLEQRLAEVTKERDALKTKPPKETRDPPLTCGHNSYWKTVYDHCMACRAEQAEQQLTEAREQVRRLEREVRDIDTILARHWEERIKDNVLGPVEKVKWYRTKCAKLAVQNDTLRGALENVVKATSSLCTRLGHTLGCECEDRQCIDRWHALKDAAQQTVSQDK